MLEFIPFFIVLIAGLFFSELFLRFHVPWVIALIVGGIFIGPSGFGLFETNSIIIFFSEIGLIFLMFMAGLESNLFGSKPKEGYERVFKISIINTVVPFVVGTVAGLSLGFDNTVAFLIGIVFASTSVAVLLPSLESMKLLRCGLGKVMINVGILNDILALTLLAVITNSLSGSSPLGIISFLLLFLASLWFLKVLVPKIIWFFEQDIRSEKDLFQQEIRTILVILVGVVLLFELIGLDPVISGFFAGIFVAGSATSGIVKEKIRTIGYGVFIPIFFISVGASINIFSEDFVRSTLVLAITLTLLSLLSKYFSGYLGASIAHFSRKESKIIAASTMPQMSVPLAVAITGLNEGFIDANIFSVLVVLTIVTTIIGPVLLKILSRNYIRREVEVE
jgi:Kef-type K+ transport system membrane component KefB